MKTLGIVLIVKNEEACLAKCLESVKGADEIYITDTGSKDKTKEIAYKYTDKVYDFEWIDDFAAARNFAKSKATTDYCLSIDADEVLISPIEDIKKFIQTAKGKTFYVTMTAGARSHNLGRLFKNDEDVKWVGAGHEVITPAEDNHSGFVIEYGYSPAHKLDPDRMLRILKKDVEKNPSSRNLYYLAREYMYKKDYITAIWWFNEYLKIAKWKPEIADAYLKIARCYWQLQKGDDARMMCMHAIRYNPDFKEALEFMSETHYEPMKSRWGSFSRLADNTGVLFKKDSPKIPKIIHQIWIGKRPVPTEWINTWREKHPDWEHILWDDKAVEEFGLVNKKLYDYYRKNGCPGSSPECTASNVIRPEILYTYGGVYLDADSVCKERIDELIDTDFFGVYSPHLKNRVVSGFLGIIPEHPMMKEYVERMSRVEKFCPTWDTIGGTMFTELVKKYNLMDKVLPSYTFLPNPPGLEPYKGSGKVYADHFAETTLNPNYES